MEPTEKQFELPKFSSPEEELRYLRERVTHSEHKLWQEQVPVRQESIISEQVIEYAKSSPQATLEEHMIMENPQFESVVEHISSLPHREKVRELYRILAEKGVLNAVKVAQSQNNPHIEEDFHRVLVEYVKSGALVPGLDKERELAKELHMSVYEITLPFAGSSDNAEVISFKDVMNAMERFYIGMLPSTDKSLYQYGPVVLEIALSNFSNDIVFYISVQEHMKDLFLKQILGAFPMAKIEENPGDFNIFNEFGVTTASYGEAISNFVYPIQMMEEGDKDPFTVILNSFTNIEREGEGAAVQIIFFPETENLTGKIKYAMGQIHQGVTVARATNIPLSTGGVIAKTFTEFFHTQVKEQKKDAKPDGKELEFSQKAVAMMEEKIKSPLVRANIRVIVSSTSYDRADAIRTSVEAAFSQFNRPQGGGIKFSRIEKAKLERVIHQFTYREKNEDEVVVLNTKELASLYHLPGTVSQKDVPQLKTIKTTSAPAPSDLPSEGTLIGINKYRGVSREVRLTKADRLRHLYTLGQTGAGKSVFLKNLAVQDILAGNGVCFIDPHGSDVQDILAAVPPERIDDVIYFDPTYTPRPFALNMLEYDINHPEQKIFVVNEMLSIFKTLYASSPESMGPAFEQYFRYSTLLVMEDPESGNTLLEIPRVMADVNFRNLKLSRCKNPIVVQFWRDIAGKTTGESGLQNMIPYITNKFDIFISNEVMRPIIAQEKSSFNFRDIMDNKKILLVNLAKGKLGEINANLLGLIIVGKFLMAAMSRVDSFGKPLPDFYLYVDEFQNISTPSIAAILSEARKYGLSLNLAHQYIAQLRPDIKDAVFGNVGNMVVFRVGAEDAQFLESQFAPIFKASDIMKIENRNAFAKILINGKPVSPFNLEMLPPPTGHPEICDKLKNLSYLKYGRDRKTVDDAILKRYAEGKQQPAVQAVRPPAPPTPPSAPRPIITPPIPVTPTQTASQFADAFARAQMQNPATQVGMPIVPIPVPELPYTPPPQSPPIIDVGIMPTAPIGPAHLWTPPGVSSPITSPGQPVSTPPES